MARLPWGLRPETRLLSSAQAEGTGAVCGQTMSREMPGRVCGLSTGLQSTTERIKTTGFPAEPEHQKRISCTSVPCDARDVLTLEAAQVDALHNLKRRLHWASLFHLVTLARRRDTARREATGPAPAV